jgi:hypothetical protein
MTSFNRLFILAAALFPAGLAMAQNSFPASGNVGVGTTAPSTLLYLKQTSLGNPGYTPVLGIGYDDGMVLGGSLGMRVVPGNFRQGLKISSNLNLTFHSPVATGNAAFQWQTGTVLGANETTDANAVMTLTGAGNLGIGTTAPGRPLDVFGTIRAYTDAFGGRLTFGNGNATDVLASQAGDGSASLSFNLWNGSTNITTMYLKGSGKVGIGTSAPDSTLSLESSGEAALHINSVNSTPVIRFKQGGVSKWGVIGEYPSAGKLSFYSYTLGSSPLILSDSGNVGIGTTTAGSPLDVYYAASTAANNPGNAAIRVTAAVGANPRFLNIGYDATLDEAYLQPVHSGSGGFYSNLALNPNGGNVGIGTTNPTQKLSVNGSIRAHEVIVDTGWSDYVFAPDYALAPLSEVDAHIKAHHTLPGVPSAAQVAKEGISVGEMQAKLLAKMEEMTLYVIDLKKENTAMKTKIAELEKKTVTQ